MVKIFIIGGPGSGKTTLAKKLSTKFDAPHYDLDRIGWLHGANMATHIDEAAAITRQPSWIAEGNYLIWTDALLYQADAIIFLEIPWILAAWRILRRHISKTLRGSNPYPTKLLFNFLKDTRHYYVDKVSSDPTVAKAVRVYLDEHEKDVEAAEPELLLARLEKCRVTIPLTADFVRSYLEKYQEKVFFVKNGADRGRLFDLLMKERLKER